MLDPEWFSDERLAKCAPCGFQLFIGLLCLTDVEGKLEDRSTKIKVKIFPYGFDKLDIDLELNKLEQAGLISRYDVDGEKVILINNFKKLGITYNNEKAAGLPDRPAGYQLPTNCLPAGDQLNINNNIIYNNITNTNTLTVSEDTTPEVINSPKEVKKEKPELEKLGSHFRATREQIEKLILEDGEAVFKTRVQTINDYCAANGKSYKDYPAAYRNFRKGDAERKAKEQKPLFESDYARSQRILKENREKFKSDSVLTAIQIFTGEK